MAKYEVPIKIRPTNHSGTRYQGLYGAIPLDVRTALSTTGSVVTIEQSWQNFIHPDDYEIVKEEEPKKKAKASKKVAVDIDGDGVADVIGEIVEEEEKAEE